VAVQKGDGRHGVGKQAVPEGVEGVGEEVGGAGGVVEVEAIGVEFGDGGGGDYDAGRVVELEGVES
jgi:hypothetical protein